MKDVKVIAGADTEPASKLGKIFKAAAPLRSGDYPRGPKDHKHGFGSARHLRRKQAAQERRQAKAGDPRS